MLTQLEFTDFRGFRHLKLEGLQRVNLIVGKNNSGKTSLLEGITVLLQPNVAGTVLRRYRQLESGLTNNFNGNTYSQWLLNDKAKNDELTLDGIWGKKPRKFKLSLFDQFHNVLTPQEFSKADLKKTQKEE